MPISIILACIGIFRLLAFSLHDATLIPQTVVVEIVLSVWLAIASRKLSVEESTNVQ